MIIAAHQPAYMPWLGYLDKVAKVDVFVVMDDAPYEPQNFQNRNRLKLADGPRWLTVPVVHGGQGGERIVDMRIDNAGFGGRHHWQQRTWRTLVSHYGRAAFFDRYVSDLEQVFTQRWDWLVELDLAMLDLARTWLGITGPVIRASTLQLEGQRTERIAALCERLDAKVYLSGDGGARMYLDVSLLARRGIAVMWQQFVHPTYPQQYAQLGFCSHLAFVDLVLNCGPTSAALMWEVRDESSVRG